MVIDLVYFDMDPFGVKEIISICCGISVMFAMAILSYSKEVLFSFWFE